MFKKIGISTALFLISTSTALATDVMLPYFGAEVGYDTGKWKLRDATSVQTTSSSNGVFGGFFGGLSFTLAQRIFANIEVFGNESSTSIDSQQVNLAGGGTSQVKLRMKYSYGGAVLPGFKFTDAVNGYLRLGILKSRFELHQAIPPAGSSSNWGDNNATGGQLGLGIQGNINDLWGVRAEYDYVTYNSFTIFGNNISAHDNQFKIGVLYKFE